MRFSYANCHKTHKQIPPKKAGFNSLLILSPKKSEFNV